jgi:hypothetical protein
VFGYKINPDGDNAAEVLIKGGGIADGTFYGRILIDTKLSLVAGERVVFVETDPDSSDAWIYDGPAVWNGGATAYSVNPKTAGNGVYVLYKFTVTSSGDPAVLRIDDSLTHIVRFLYIEDGGGGETIPAGTEANPHLVWDHDAQEWVVGVIVPDGTTEHPHLVWNETAGSWETDKLLDCPDGGDTDCILAWDAASPTEWLAKESNEITVVTDVRFDTATMQLQKKTRKIRIIAVENESAWTMVSGGQESCP